MYAVVREWVCQHNKIYEHFDAAWSHKAEKLSQSNYFWWLISKKTWLFFLFYWVSKFSSHFKQNPKIFLDFYTLRSNLTAQMCRWWHYFCVVAECSTNQLNSMEIVILAVIFIVFSFHLMWRVRVFCALVSSSHRDRALFIARVSIYVTSDMYTVRALSLSSRMIFWCFVPSKRGSFNAYLPTHALVCQTQEISLFRRTQHT